MPALNQLDQCHRPTSRKATPAIPSGHCRRPLGSERFYEALKGQGATVRLVWLPLEAHGYQAHESLQHMLWEMNRWLDTYVKPETAASQ